MGRLHCAIWFREAKYRPCGATTLMLLMWSRAQLWLIPSAVQPDQMGCRSHPLERLRAAYSASFLIDGSRDITGRAP